MLPPESVLERHLCRSLLARQSPDIQYLPTSLFVHDFSLAVLYSRLLAYAVVTDVICTVLPIYVVWNVRIPWSTKAAVCGLMSMGLVYVTHHHDT